MLRSCGAGWCLSRSVSPCCTTRSASKETGATCLPPCICGDPELWWRLADANGVIEPSTMTLAIGRRLRITLPEDVPGGLDG